MAKAHVEGWELAQYRYAVPILMLLKDKGALHQNAIRKMLGSEYSPIHKAIVFMLERGLVIEQTPSGDNRITTGFRLTELGFQYARVFADLEKRLQAISP